MENKLIHNMALSLTAKLNRYTGKEGLELKKMTYGMEVLIINISKIIILYLLAWALGIVVQTLIIHAAYGVIRRYSYGLHALNSTVCTVVSCCMFVFIPWLMYGMEVGNIAVACAFAAIIFCLWRYAPADTEARPLVGPKMRARVKKKAVACGIGLMITALLMPSQAVKLLILMGAAYQTISILPLTYKILKRSERNYEKHEQCV